MEYRNIKNRETVSCSKFFLWTWIFFLSLHPLRSPAQGADLRILDRINGPQSSFDPFWKGVSNSAFYFSASVPVVQYGFGYSQDKKLFQRDAFNSAMALGINTAVTFGMKWSINRERPFVNHPEIYKKSGAGSYSFPSGHTSMAFAIATSLTLACPKWYVALPAYAWAGCVGYSRMHLGVHYPSDVLAGALVGIASSFVAVKANQALFK